jgi:DNA repair exonuclease SbcCD nuclease subunit
MSSPLLILHLSDLHFGLHSRFAGEKLKELAARLHKAIEDARTKMAP